VCKRVLRSRGCLLCREVRPGDGAMSSERFSDNIANANNVGTMIKLAKNNNIATSSTGMARTSGTSLQSYPNALTIASVNSVVLAVPPRSLGRT